MLKNKGKKKNEVQKVRFTLLHSLSSVFKYIPKVKKIQHLLFTGSNRLFGDLEKKVNLKHVTLTQKHYWVFMR